LDFLQYYALIPFLPITPRASVLHFKVNWNLDPLPVYSNSVLCCADLRNMKI
jgi:hypothetical protein